MAPKKTQTIIALLGMNSVYSQEAPTDLVHVINEFQLLLPYLQLSS